MNTELESQSTSPEQIPADATDEGRAPLGGRRGRRPNYKPGSADLLRNLLLERCVQIVQADGQPWSDEIAQMCLRMLEVADRQFKREGEAQKLYDKLASAIDAVEQYAGRVRGEWECMPGCDCGTIAFASDFLKHLSENHLPKLPRPGERVWSRVPKNAGRRAVFNAFAGEGSSEPRSDRFLAALSILLGREDLEALCRLHQSPDAAISKVAEGFRTTRNDVVAERKRWKDKARSQQSP